MIVKAVMVPHPPLAVSEVGRGDEKKIQKTLDAYHQAAREQRSGCAGLDCRRKAHQYQGTKSAKEERKGNRVCPFPRRGNN